MKRLKRKQRYNSVGRSVNNFDPLQIKIEGVSSADLVKQEYQQGNKYHFSILNGFYFTAINEPQLANGISPGIYGLKLLYWLRISRLKNRYNISIGRGSRPITVVVV